MTTLGRLHITDSAAVVVATEALLMAEELAIFHLLEIAIGNPQGLEVELPGTLV